jgi:hypothetical protein
MFSGKRLGSALLALAILMAGGAGAVAADDAALAALTKRARALVKGFGMNLKGTLMQELKKNGPVSAIHLCNRKAEEIANVFSVRGWTVGRTALKLRNAMQNAPDDFERETLRIFEKKLKAGADPNTLERAEIVNEDGRRVFRYMKAIIVKKPCLTCHGENIRPEVRDAIGASYPKDDATGIRPGDLRGAFTLRKVLQ